jgi:hypothetical protein
MTLVNWREGHVQRPRVWQDVGKVAHALRLSPTELNELLAAAGYPNLSQLNQQAATVADRELLAFWLEEKKSPDKRPPFQALPNLPTFVGRKTELSKLAIWLRADYHESAYVLDGAGGTGKTVLAARLAYQLRDHFSDGVLWARLDTTDVMSILHLFAAAYGQDVSVYTDVGSRSTAVRELLAHKQALVVLDNVQNSEEIRPLLPPSGPCAVLVTTRRRHLTVANKAHRFHVEPFTPEETMALFTKVLGPELMAQEESTLLEIASTLGHLPLAVDIVACRLAYEPGWRAVDFLKRLLREQAQLELLVYEDRDVRMAIETSFALLPSSLQRFWVTLGHIRELDFSVEVAAAVTDIPTEEAEMRLRELFSLSLLRRGRQNRYRFLPTLQSFAREKSVSSTDILSPK